jgi:hypothetical protein
MFQKIALTYTVYTSKYSYIIKDRLASSWRLVGVLEFEDYEQENCSAKVWEGK